MSSSSKLLPLAAMEKILKQSGANRVSDKAKVALKNTVEDLADGIATKAVNLAKHAGRVTVKASDIKLAAKS
jgi:histone H3/H4|tara:strand:+ start:5677 stop:5892 length:216 start_codon:yes stop_codon:yes gene_type:complete